MRLCFLESYNKTQIKVFSVLISSSSAQEVCILSSCHRGRYSRARHSRIHAVFSNKYIGGYLSIWCVAFFPCLPALNVKWYPRLIKQTKTNSDGCNNSLVKSSIHHDPTRRNLTHDTLHTLITAANICCTLVVCSVSHWTHTNSEWVLFSSFYKGRKWRREEQANQKLYQ